MATHDEITKWRKQSQSTASTTPSQQTTKGTGSSSDDWITSMRKQWQSKKDSEPSGVSIDFINSYLNDVFDYQQKANARLSKMDYSTAQSFYDINNTELENLRKRHDELDEYFKTSGNTLGIADYDGLLADLQSIRDMYDEVQTAYDEAKTAHGEWSPNALGISAGAFNALNASIGRRDDILASGGSYEDWYNEMLSERDTAHKTADELYNKKRTLETNYMWDESGADHSEELAALDAEWKAAKEAATYADFNFRNAETHRYDDIDEGAEGLREVAAGKDKFEAYQAEKANNPAKTEALDMAASAGMGSYSDSDAVVEILAADESYWQPKDNWTDDESRQFYVLFNRNEEEAKAYGELVNNTHNAEAAYEEQQKAAEWATKNTFNSVLATMGSIVGAATSGYDVLMAARENEARGTVTQKSYLTPADYGNVMTSAISTALNEKDGAFNEALSKLEPIFGEVGAGDVYQMGYNALQSWVYANTMGPMSMAAYFGIGAKSGFEDAMARGATPEKAFLNGVLSGSIELLTEQYSLDNLIKIRTPTSLKGVVKNALIQGGIEMSEEEVSFLANTIVDGILMGDQSSYNKAVEEYILQGMSAEEASRRASSDWLKEGAYTALSSFGSGSMGGIAQSASQAFSTYRGDTHDLINRGLATPEGSDARVNAEGLAAYIQQQEEKAQSRGTTFAKAKDKVAGKFTPGEAYEQKSGVEPKKSTTTRSAKEFTPRISNLKAQRLTEQIAQAEAKSRLEAAGVEADAKTLDAIAHALSTNDELTAEEVEILSDEKVSEVANQMRVYEILGVGWDYESKKNKMPAIQSKYDVSEDGKTIDTNTGEEVSIVGIASLKDGRMTLKLSNGKVVSSDSVSYGSNGEALIYETVASLDTLPVIANELVRGYDPESGVSPEVYARGIQEAFVYGQYNLPESEMLAEGTFSADLTAEQRQLAYKSGQKFSGMAIAKQQAEIKKGKAVAKVEAVANQTHINDFNPSTFDTSTEQGRGQRASYNVAKMMSEVLGVDIYFFESYVKDNKRVYIDEKGNEVEAPNGYYKNGAIHIDLNAGNNGEGTMLFTLSHELTHFIKEWSPAKFKVLANFLNEQYGKKGISVDVLVRQQMKKARDAGRTLTYDEAYEEFVADSMETMLTDGKVAEKLALLKQQDKNLWQKIRDFISDIYAKVVKAYEGMNPNSAEGKYVSEMVDALENLQQLFAEGLAEASVNYQGSFAPGKAGTVFNAEGQPVAHSTEDGSVQLSMRTYEEDGREAFRKYLTKCVSSNRLTQAEMDEMISGIEEIYNVCKEFKDKYAPFGTWSEAAVVRDTYGKPVFSVVTPNGEYKMNLDFSLVCKKRRTLDAVFNEMSKRGIIDDFELGQKSVVKINELIREHGFETACALCFVDAKRFRQAAMADQFVGLYNELVESLVPESKRDSINKFNFSGYSNKKPVADSIDTWEDSKLDFSHLNHVLATYGKGTVEWKSANYIKNNPAGRKLLLRGDFMSSGGFDAVKTQNPQIMKLYNSKKDTGGPKAAFGDVQYMNEIIKKSRGWTPAKAYSVGGVRIQSFSDYVPRMVFDYVQMIYDLAATKLPAHAYTKEALFVKQFGLTGIKINMSLIPAIAEGGIAPGLDANGNYVWAGESFDYETAKEIQNAEGYTENCGTICVGVSKEHITKLLGDPNIRMVIPYHKSGLNPVVAHMNKIAAFTDYTSLATNPGGCQSTCDKSGNKLAKDFNFNATLKKTGDPKAVVREYLDWCSKNEYTPRFAEFAWHENYYKLIEDFTLFDKDGKYAPQREVRAVFPTKDSAFGSMKDLIESGLEEDAIIEGKRERGLSAIVDEIEKSLPRTEAEIEEVEVKQADRDLEAGVKYQARQMLSEEAKVFANDIDIWDKAGRPDGETFILGSTGGVFQGLGAIESDIYMLSDKINTIFKDHPEMTVKEIKSIPEILENPVLVLTSRNTWKAKANTRLVVFGMVKAQNGLSVMATFDLHPTENKVYLDDMQKVVSAYTKDNSPTAAMNLIKNSDVMYADKDKTASLLHTVGFQYAYRIEQSGYIGNISYEDDEVKATGKKFSDVFFEEKNSGKPQTRGNANLEKVNAVLEKQNAKLREDIKELKELLKIQKSVTNGTKLTPSSVEAVSKKLMRDIHSKGEVSELKALLGAFYSEVRNNESTSLDDYKELAQPVVDWLHDHMVTEETKQDASAFAYESDLIEQDIFSQVLSSYWDVSTLHTVADVKQKQINELKAKHNARTAELKNIKREVAALKEAHKEEVARIRTEAREERLAAEREIIRKYQESRKNSVESRAKTAEKAKIRKKISAISKLLNRGTKARNVKEGLQEVAAQALKTADILFTEAYSDNDMIRDGIQIPMTADEKRYMAEAKSLLDRISKLPIGTDERNNLEGQLSYLKGKLKDVLFRERARLYDADVSMAFDELAKVYKKIKESPYSYIAEAYDEEVAKMLETMSEEIGGKKIRDMTLANLELVNDAYTMVLTTIRNANKSFANSKDISEMGDAVVNEVRAVGGHKKMRGVISNAINQFGWNNMKPVYAFKAIGSDTLSKLFDNVRAGEDTWARDVYDARSFFRAQAAKTGYDKWDMTKSYTFTSTSGLEFSLTLEQMMSLYAFSKREQALDHLRKGGIVFDENTEVNVKGKLGIKQKFNPSDATAYNISAETLAEITGKLSKQQIAFVDAMQDYLSTTMGEKGNEVSMALYGVKLFKEKFYFPLRSATQYQERAKEAGKQERKVKNSGFTKPTTPKAGNPIVLAPFMDVWSNHVNDMSMYHAFVLPMEDFYKVYNYKTAAEEDTAIESVNAAIQNAYGKGAINYIDTLLKDLNGGARTDPAAGFINKAMGLFKKGAVFASASVVIQQPSAMARAFAMVDSKYFVGKSLDSKKHKALWEEVKKYAPVAMIKEMGHFDTNMGRSTEDFIKAKEYGSWEEKFKGIVTDGGYRDDVLSKAPALADELAWCKIWNAVKLETADKHKNLKVGSEEFLQAAGKRFTEVIVNTQVYDSVLSRSANMRSKDTGMKMATAFLAEPTTAINMVADALIQGKRGNAKNARRIIGSVIGAQILNSALVSLVYAARDDDEDETYWEKYLASFLAETKDSLNPATYIPFLKDIVSLVQGYEVERSDMAVIADIVNAYKQLDSDKISGWRKVENFAGGIAQLFGLPVKNIMRDARALWQVVDNAFNGESYTAAGAKYAVKEALTGEATSNGEQLLNALIEGDKAHEERVRARFKDESAATSAIRSAIKAGFESGEFDEQTATDLLMQHTGLDENDAYWKMREWTSEEDDFSRYGAAYDAMLKGESIDAAVEELTSHGYTEKKVYGQLKSQIGAWYRDGEITKEQAENMLLKYADVGANEAGEIITKWSAEAETGIAYDDVKQEFLDGKITADEAIKMRMEYGGYDKEEAEKTLADWNFEKKYGFAYSDRAALLADGKVSRDTLINAIMEYKELDRAKATAAVDYLEFQIEYPQYEKLSQTRYESYFVGLDDVNGKSPYSAGIDIGVYAEYYISIADIKGDDADGDGKTDRDSKKNKILAVINSLPLSNAQKDILYLQQYARSGIRNAPWH